jgi:hypothetical protein
MTVVYLNGVDRSVGPDRLSNNITKTESENRLFEFFPNPKFALSLFSLAMPGGDVPEAPPRGGQKGCCAKCGNMKEDSGDCGRCSQVCVGVGVGVGVGA